MGRRGSHSHANRRANASLRKGLAEQKGEVSPAEQWRILKGLFDFERNRKPKRIIIEY